MDNKRLELYRAIQIDSSAVSYDIRKFRSEIENTTLDKDTLLKGFDILISTADELAILISKTAQLIFDK